ncbi:MAG: DUF4396 domain-containing protein [Limibacillus sp.]|jgi:hypothetical protein
MHETLTAPLSNPALLIAWVALTAVCLAVLLYDLRVRNPEIMGLMRLVWFLTVFYSGPLGLALYWTTGRKQIRRDSIWRRGARSTAHCYSGCGLGEVVGIMITVGMLSLTTWWVAGVTFVLAYAFGYALTVGPLMQDGVPLKTALWDAFASETASITMMEVVAIGSDIWLSKGATMDQVLFWTSMAVSLSLGLLAAYPVNVLLIRFGVKEGMHSPKEMAE